MERNETPFRAPLEKTEYDENIKSLSSNPEKLVREYFIPILSKKSMDEQIKKFSKGKKFFERLKNDYGIESVKMNMVIGKDESGVRKMFTIVDKIEGENLENIQKIPVEAKEKFETFYLGLIQHYKDVYEKGGNFWSDFTDEQIMYGHKYNKDEDKIYVVDVCPYYRRCQKPSFISSFWRKKDDKVNEEVLINIVYKISFSIKNIEKKFSEPTILEKSRSQLDKLSRLIKKGNPH